MAFPRLNQGGAFKAPSTGMGFAHDHASQMAHVAAKKAAVGKALGALKNPAAPAAVQAPPPGGSFKMQVAHVAAQNGVHATVQHVHNAIDSLTQKGRLTPFQGHALKQHNGPLIGAPGSNTIGVIANELVSNPQVRK